MVGSSGGVGGPPCLENDETRMKICLFHPKHLPPKNYGGVERVVYWLAEGLVELGHEVWVAALDTSQLPPGAKLIPMRPDAVSALDLLRLLPPGIDVVHFHAPPEEGAWLALPCAGIVTVHGNGKPEERFHPNTVFLSHDHAQRHGSSFYVHNGVNPDEFYLAAPDERRKSFLFLSKTSWKVKNLRGAISICKKAKVSLNIAGGHRPWGLRAQVALTPGMKWIGPVGGKSKAKIFSESRAFLFPILWNEPFGLVVVESLLSGVPVIASRIGSLPELIGPEVGALLPAPLGTCEEQIWVDALRSVQDGRLGKDWNPEACRSWAVNRFSHRVMAQSYLDVYKKVISGVLS